MDRVPALRQHTHAACTSSEPYAEGSKTLGTSLPAVPKELKRLCAQSGEKGLWSVAEFRSTSDSHVRPGTLIHPQREMPGAPMIH